MRLTGTDKIRIVGIPKNASQAIKHLSYNNKNIHNWEVDNLVKEHKFFDRKKDFYDKNLTIIFPLRDEFERIKSGFIQHLHDKLYEFGMLDGLTKANEEKYKVKIKKFIKTTFNRDNIPAIDLNTTFKAELHSGLRYFENEALQIWFREAFENKNWEGFKMYFIDSKDLSNSKFIDWLCTLDSKFKDSEIPIYNTTKGWAPKRVIVDSFNDIVNDEDIDILNYKIVRDWSPDIQLYIRFTDIFWKGIKRTKYFKKF